MARAGTLAGIGTGGPAHLSELQNPGCGFVDLPLGDRYTTAESLGAFYKHFEALKECGEWDC